MKTLTGYKMEKILIGVIDKGRSRDPALKFNFRFLVDRIKQETEEIEAALFKIQPALNPSELDFENAMKEVADVSNFCDFLADRILKKYLQKEN
jgi:hypothetical protein